MTQKGEKARELFLEGYTCAQSVAGAFAEEMGMPIDTVLRIAMPFGGGMGRLREVCGTFSGMVLVVGQLYGDNIPKSPNKAQVYSIVQKLAERFKAEYGTIICHELLGELEARDTDPLKPSERTDGYYQKRPCAGVCAAAASILENYLSEI
ncbi:MAG: C_GCAxxG_C_C family protein [Clostridia bacterium]|nr:C_GCAxxG_C_C family protein [Clostridia bacterium]